MAMKPKVAVTTQLSISLSPPSLLPFVGGYIHALLSSQSLSLSLSLSVFPFFVSCSSSHLCKARFTLLQVFFEVVLWSMSEFLDEHGYPQEEVTKEQVVSAYLQVKTGCYWNLCQMFHPLLSTSFFHQPEVNVYCKWFCVIFWAQYAFLLLFSMLISRSHFLCTSIEMKIPIFSTHRLVLCATILAKEF